MVTDDELRQIMPNLKAARRALMLPFIQQAMQEFGITSYLREAAFLAQLAHESAELRFMEEIASGAKYEGRKDLGNTKPGDGKRYKGRGPIQLTGRANYRKYGGLLGLDLEGNPTQAATPQVGFRIAGLYWKSNGLNELADAQKFVTITKRINGGTNGLADRQMYYARAKKVLSQSDAAPVLAPPPITAPPATPTVPSITDMIANAANAAAGLITGGGTRGMGASGASVAERRDIPPNLSRGILPGLETGAQKGGAKKPAAKKSAAKKGGAKKSGAKKGGAKKSAAKKGGAKKSGASPYFNIYGAGGAKKGAAKKGAAKKGSAKKGAAKKGAAKKGAAKKGSTRPYFVIAGAGGAKKGGGKKRS
jgi:predicted chitinase